MLALFVFLAVLIIAHGLAVGAYLAIHKFGFQTTAGRATGTIVFGAAYSVVVLLITTVILMPPIG